MDINGKIYCFFEQSGTFKNEFIKLGYEAEDYDIQNEFGQTDHVMDLFAEIEKAYDGKPSIFDKITSDDLVMAFFPCIFFCENNQLYFTGKHHNLINLDTKEKADNILQRSRNREHFYELILKMFTVCDIRGVRTIVENPYATQHYLVENFPYKAAFVDRNRTLRGDYYNKPTQYWFLHCRPTFGESNQKTNIHKSIRNGKSGIRAGVCSQDRSMISSDYARNFICDFILGKRQKFTEPTLF